MKAVVYHGVGDIRLDDIQEPSLQHDFDALVRLTASAICGTDLHFVCGTVPGMQEGTVLGHEGLAQGSSKAASSSRPQRAPLNQGRTSPRNATSLQ